MSGLHLDTNAAIALLNRDPRWPPARLGVADRLRARFRAALASNMKIHLSSIALHELQFGAAKSKAPAKNMRRLDDLLSGGITSLPFESADGAVAGRIRAALARQGTPIGPYDILIAGHAMSRGATLVTANTREFPRIAGLNIEDWTQP